MLYIRLRFLLIGLFLVIGIVLFFKIGLWAAIPSFSGALVLIGSFYLLGTVGQAFSKLKQGKIVEAQQLINLNKNPKYLIKGHRAYYHFVSGMLALQQKNLDLGNTHFRNASELGLRNDNDRAFAALNLAHIHYLKKDFDQASSFLTECKSFQTNDLMLDEKMKELEKALANA